MYQFKRLETGGLAIRESPFPACISLKLNEFYLEEPHQVLTLKM